MFLKILRFWLFGPALRSPAIFGVMPMPTNDLWSSDICPACAGWYRGISRDDDGNRVCGLFRLFSTNPRHCDNHVDFAFDEFHGKRTESFWLLVRKAIFQFKVLTLDVAKVTESLSKSAQIDFFLLGATCMPKNSHAGHLFSATSKRGRCGGISILSSHRSKSFDFCRRFNDLSIGLLGGAAATIWPAAARSGSEKVSKVGEFGDYLPGYYCVNQWWLWRRINLVEVSRARRLSQEVPNARIQCAVHQQVRAGAINAPLTIE